MSKIAIYFHLPLHYKDHSTVMNTSLDTANINAINISTLDFRDMAILMLWFIIIPSSSKGIPYMPLWVR